MILKESFLCCCIPRTSPSDHTVGSLSIFAEGVPASLPYTLLIPPSFKLSLKYHAVSNHVVMIISMTSESGKPLRGLQCPRLMTKPALNFIFPPSLLPSIPPQKVKNLIPKPWWHSSQVLLISLPPSLMPTSTSSAGTPV